MAPGGGTSPNPNDTTGVDTMMVDTMRVDTTDVDTNRIDTIDQNALRQMIESRSGEVLLHPQFGTILRTPVERFNQLEDYPWPSFYLDVDPGDTLPLYMHYIDVGPRNGEVILLLHGNPSWSYGVRELVEPLVAKGYRVIAPDLIGFGKSDKPLSRDPHAYDNHVLWMRTLVQGLDLQNITLHCQDWGGLIGLRVAMYESERFARVAASNTGLPEGTIGDEASFSRWRDVISQRVAKFSQIIEASTSTSLSPAQIRAYDAPFPEDRYTAGPRKMPSEVPFDPTSAEALENLAILDRYRTWTKPFMTVFSEDPVTGITAGSQEMLSTIIPGAQGQTHINYPESLAAHFIREDIPDSITFHLHQFILRNPL